MVFVFWSIGIVNVIVVKSFGWEFGEIVMLDWFCVFW